MACILVVEDERNIRQLYTTILEQSGHEVMEAADGRDALVALKKRLPDMMITDLRMPDMNGVQLIAEVARRYPNLPVVVISAFIDQIEHALRTGAKHYLVKPFTKRQLVEVVNTLLEQGV